MTATINSGANSLVAGSYSDTVTLTNTTNGTGNTTRAVALTVNAAAGALSVSAGSLTSSGTVGGPFTPSAESYTLTNTGGTCDQLDGGEDADVGDLRPPAGRLRRVARDGDGDDQLWREQPGRRQLQRHGDVDEHDQRDREDDAYGSLTCERAAVLTSVTVSGPSSVNEGGTGTYTATGTWDNGTTSAISPTWSVSTSYATIGSGGVLTALAVTSDQAVTVTASYGGKTGTKTVTIVNVPGAAPAAPKNIDISGPTSIGPTEIYRLSWDPVTTNWNGAPIEPGRTVRYTAYWTDDPALSTGSLRQLASLIPDTALDFDPSANRMAKNQVVYLTVRAILDTGDESSLGSGLIWRVENAGPLPPAKGKILKK